MKLRLVSNFPMSLNRVLFLQWDLFVFQSIRYCCAATLAYHGRRRISAEFYIITTGGFIGVRNGVVSAGFAAIFFQREFGGHALRYPAPLCTAGGLARASHPGEPHTRASRQLDLRHVAKACRMVATVIRWSQLSPKLYSGDR